MNDNRYYPRRTDMVHAVRFDGMVESVQMIAQVVQRPVTAEVDGQGYARATIDGVTVKPFQFVVADRAGFKVLDHNEFVEQYSADGF